MSTIPNEIRRGTYNVHNDRYEIGNKHDKEVDNAILEEDRHQLQLLLAAPELDNVQDHDDQIEHHQVDECCSEDPVVCLDDRTAQSRNPYHSQLGFLQDERPVAKDDEYEQDDNVEPL